MSKLNILSKKAIIFFLITIIVIIGVTSVSYAYWGGNAERPLTNQESPELQFPETDLTYRYMIFKVNNIDKNYYLRYFDNGYYDYINVYEGYEDSLTEDEKSAKKESFTSTTTVELILYIGALGEYETIKIPEKINVLKGLDSQNAPILVEMTVTSINLDIGEMSASKDLIKTVTIPASVTHIRGVSFSGFNLLTRVNYLGTQAPSISKAALLNPEPAFYVNGTSTTITRQADII